VAVGLIIGAKYWHPLTYIIQPFVTLGRTFPTLAVQIIFVAFCPLSLVSIIIPFLIVFPMTIQSLTSAIDNVNANNIEMVNVFRVSKFDQLRYVYLRAVTPYIFGALIAGFGLTFKVVLASQVLAGATPNYASIGYIMTKANGAKSYDIILA
jgi:NitT/TauT family transport system permease protein